MRKKVILYNPHAVFFDMPLALLSIASALDPARYECIIADVRVDENAAETVLHHLPDAVCLGITVLTGRPIRDALSMTRRAKAACPQVPIVWGGWHPSLFPTETLRDEPAVDITVQAQGEMTFRELVDALAEGHSLENVAGICYRTPSGALSRNPARALTDMNELPPVNYDLIPVERYFAKKGRRQFDYISSTGCRFRCTFCADPFVFSRKWTAIEPERMVAEFTHWHCKHGFTDVNLQDETFFTHRKRTVEFADRLLQSGIGVSWAGTLRADQSERMDEAEFALVVRSGFRRALIGVESGTQEMLDWLKKDIKLEQVWAAAERCKRHGIGAIFPFIVGFPGESDASIKASLNFAKRLRAMSPKFSTPVFYFKPYPGSVITQAVVEQGYVLPEHLEEWADFDYVGGSSGPWVREDIYRLVERFKFYNHVAERPSPWFARPLQQLARWRMRRDFFRFPIEKRIVETLMPRQALS